MPGTETEKDPVMDELNKIRAAQEDFPDTTSFLIQGETGTGKTHLIGTAPAPIFVDSFDQRGPETILEHLKSGRAIADRRWEIDDPRNPTVAQAWYETFIHRKRMGFFDRLGTYAIDSATGLLRSIMYSVLKKEGRAGGVPQQNDWLPQMTAFENIMTQVTALPCNVIVTFHLTMDKDEASGQLVFRPMVTGKLAVRVPLMFSEIYVAGAQSDPTGIKYGLLTQATGRYIARTRMGTGIFKPSEEPHIQSLLKRAGRAWQDKEL